MNRNGKDLVAFWDYAAEKGLMRRDTADTIKSACRVVLSTVEPDAWEGLDVGEVDVESLISRFEKLKMSDLKPDSLRVYGNRVRRGIDQYLQFLQAPTTWSYPTAGKRASATGRSNGKNAPRQARRAAPAEAPDDSAAGPTSPAAEGLVAYPYPLRAGLMVKLQLPADLSRQEARRLAAFVESLVLEPQLALPSGDTNEGPRDAVGA